MYPRKAKPLDNRSADAIGGTGGGGGGVAAPFDRTQKSFTLPKGQPRAKDEDLYIRETPQERKNRFRLRRKAAVYRVLGNNATLIGWLSGLAVAGAVLSSSALMLHELIVNEINVGHSRAVDRARDVASDTNKALKDVAEVVMSGAPGFYGPTGASCSDEVLARLRAITLSSHYQKATAIHDDQGTLLCSSVFAVQQQKQARLEGGLPTRVQGVDQTFWVRAQPFTSSPEVRVTYVLRKNAGVMVADNAFSLDFFGLNSVWIDGGMGADLTLLGSRKMPKESLDALYRLAQPRGDLQGLRFDRGLPPSFVHSSYVHEGGMTVQTVLPLSDALLSKKETAGFWLLVSFVTGGVFGHSLARALSRFRSIRRRIDFILSPENIVCVYQPVIDMSTGKAVGCEVLVRFRDGADVVSPGPVLDAVMARGLDWKLDQLIVRKAWFELDAYFGEKSARGASTFIGNVSFNMFPQNIRVSKLAPLFAGLKAETGTEPPFKFIVEIVEQSYTPEIFREITMLRDQGFRFSVDDFGTGFSNLNTVKRLAPYSIKIDRSFVHDVQDHTLRSSLIPEIVSIAKAVGAKVIAEGIETAEQAEILQGFGVTLTQGFFYAKPMPIASFRDFMREHGSDVMPD